jgi:CelD/BcsL family acetyltransferase involved in cellulose biosynthesis
MDTVETVGIDGLRASRAEWAGLTASMHYPTVFCSWEWVYTWWEHFSAGRDLRLLMVRRNGQLRSILPLFSERKIMTLDGRFGHVLGYCGVPNLFPDPIDIISADADARECIMLTLDHLYAKEKNWDVLHLRFLAKDSYCLRGIADVRWEGRAYAEQISAAPYISIRGSYEDYLQGLSSNERSNVRRRRRKLLEDKDVVYTDFNGEDPQRILQALFNLHEKRAEQKKMLSTFSQKNVIAFQMSLLNRLDPQHVWFRGLRKGQDVIAVFFGYVIGRCIAYYQLGYDPAWGAFSPGSVLLQETIREAFENGYAEYNFLQGVEDFKYRWASEARVLYSADVFNRSWLGRLSWHAVASKRLLKLAPVTGG